MLCCVVLCVSLARDRRGFDAIKITISEITIEISIKVFISVMHDSIMRSSSYENKAPGKHSN